LRFGRITHRRSLMVAIPRTLIDTRSAPELLAGAPFILIAVDNDGFLELPGMPLDMDWDRQRIRHRPSLKYLEALLSHGADPCKEYGGSTAWNHVIDRFSEILHDPEVLEACQGSPIWQSVSSWTSPRSSLITGQVLLCFTARRRT
jgi:hypothetical protein